MIKSTMMFRLIDIVFILLFGFISISEIGLQHPIEPPKSTEQRSQTEKFDHILFLGITRSGTYIVETPSNEVYKYSNISQINELLESIRREFGNESDKIQVQICSNWDAPIKYALDVADLCDSYQLRKSLLVRKVEKPL
ncbi:biopolymer transporter ExbD [candidate division KSB1 bacterium]|nr:biopolymer transporter ExbD [candidate division KSB1 bacterium]